MTQDHATRSTPAAATSLATERERATFLGTASRMLLSSLDYLGTLQKLSDLAVPVLGDWCAVDMLKADGSLARLAVTHSDPEKVKLAHELWRRHPPRMTDPAGVANVIRTGQAELTPHVSDEILVAASLDAEHLAIMRSLASRSAVAMPLTASGTVHGVLTLVYAESERTYQEADLAFIEEFARLAAIAVDNARLFEAETLARTKAEQSEQAFRAFVENLPTLAWSALPDGHIDFYNRRWYEYTGTTFEDMAGWGWERVHAPELLPQVVSRWKHSLATGEPFEMEFTLRGADGVPRWFLTRVSPQRDASGAILRWFGTNTDINDIVAAKALSNEMAAQSREAEAMLIELRAAKQWAEQRVIELEAELARLRGRG